MKTMITRRIPRILLFLGLFVVLYGLFGTLLIFHDYRDDADRTTFRRAVALDQAIYRLKLRKDSLYQQPPTGQLLAELLQTDSLLTRHEAEHLYLYSPDHKKKLLENRLALAQLAPYSYFRSVFLPTLPVLPGICCLLAGLLYAPARRWLLDRYGSEINPVAATR